MSPSSSRAPRILCVSFSPLRADSRVLRQIGVLLEHGVLTTVGYGPAPLGVDLHIEVPESASSLPETPLGVSGLTLRLHGVDALRDITPEDVSGYKAAADRAARALSSDQDQTTQHALITRLLTEQS